MVDPRGEIQLFICEVDRLLSRSFVAQFRERDVCFSESSDLDNSPTIEQLESFVLHFRKFWQSNDRVSIVCVRKHFDALKPSPAARMEWEQLHTVFDEMKASNAIVKRSLSLGKLFEARTYGDLSHLGADKRLVHVELSATPQSEALYRFEFSTFLAETAELLEQMACLCKQVMGEVA